MYLLNSLAIYAYLCYFFYLGDRDTVIAISRLEYQYVTRARDLFFLGFTGLPRARRTQVVAEFGGGIAEFNSRGIGDARWRDCYIPAMYSTRFPT